MTYYKEYRQRWHGICPWVISSEEREHERVNIYVLWNIENANKSHEVKRTGFNVFNGKYLEPNDGERWAGT